MFRHVNLLVPAVHPEAVAGFIIMEPCYSPLMSGSNAISGVTIVGALLMIRSAENYPTLASVLGFVALVCATINVVGGFLVTDRMLAMFKKKS